MRQENRREEMYLKKNREPEFRKEVVGKILEKKDFLVKPDKIQLLREKKESEPDILKKKIRQYMAKNESDHIAANLLGASGLGTDVEKNPEPAVSMPLVHMPKKKERPDKKNIALEKEKTMHLSADSRLPYCRADFNLDAFHAAVQHADRNTAILEHRNAAPLSVSVRSEYRAVSGLRPAGVGSAKTILKRAARQGISAGKRAVPDRPEDKEQKEALQQTQKVAAWPEQFVAIAANQSGIKGIVKREFFSGRTFDGLSNAPKANAPKGGSWKALSNRGGLVRSRYRYKMPFDNPDNKKALELAHPSHLSSQKSVMLFDVRQDCPDIREIYQNLGIINVPERGKPNLKGHRGAADYKKQLFQPDGVQEVVKPLSGGIRVFEVKGGRKAAASKAAFTSGSAKKTGISHLKKQMQIRFSMAKSVIPGAGAAQAVRKIGSGASKAAGRIPEMLQHEKKRSNAGLAAGMLSLALFPALLLLLFLVFISMFSSSAATVNTSSSYTDYTATAAEKEASEKIWLYLQEYGLSDITTAALIGNLYQESSLNPRSGENERHVGLVQWSNPGRWTSLVNQARSEKRDKWDMEMQLDFMMSELQSDDYGGYWDVLDFCESCGNLEYLSEKEPGAVWYVARYYEICISSSQKYGVQDYDKRLRAAQRYYKWYVEDVSDTEDTSNN
ncbi:MAG: phage tail tip lysozyme [Clostridiaceae bacterium]|nr:phage tail tip lysozyme [Clostridiaceae bacterium]